MTIFSAQKLRKKIIVFGSFFLLTGCETLSTIPNPVAMPNGDYRETVQYLPHAATTPVRDLNIGVPAVPRQLKLLQNPYGTDRSRSCSAIKEELSDLETALASNHSNLNGPNFNHDTRAGYAGEAAHDAMTAAATSLVPYRGVIRYMSGATRREKEGIAADRRGRQRMGFLVGLAAERRCSGFHARRHANR